jgi:hypothetical protein
MTSATGASPAGAWLPAPPPPAGGTSRRWIGWALLIGVVAVLVAVVLVPKIVRGVTAPIEAANTYLGVVQDGRTDAAYDLLCTEAQQAMTPADFAAQLAAQSEQEGALLTFDVYASMVEIGRDVAVVDYRGRASKTGSFAHQGRLVREDGQWKWCGSRPQSN